MDNPLCPFCEKEMKPSASGMDAFFKTFICSGCHAELRQVLVRPPQDAPSPGPTGKPEGCPQCQKADLYCFSCDDPICEKHIRTVEKYSNVFSEELNLLLLERYGNRIYCPLCFKNIFERFASEVSTSTPKTKSVFNLPVILFLFALILIIILGVQQWETK